jgi:hypothetical protein
LDRSSHLIDWAPRECNRGKAITLTAASDATVSATKRSCTRNADFAWLRSLRGLVSSLLLADDTTERG